MPTKTWEPPPGQEDRDRQPSTAEMDQPRNFDTPSRDPDGNQDVYYALDHDDINLNGSER